MDEFINLISQLGIEDAFDLFGNSWGGMLSAEVEVRRQPAGLRHLVLANSLASNALWEQSVVELVQTFPQEVQDGLEAGISDPPRYRDALAKFHAKHGCIVVPVPEELEYSLAQLFDDPTVESAQ